MHINQLSPEVLVQVFLQLEIVQLHQARLVCRYWNAILNDQGIWSRLLKKKLGSNLLKVPPFASNKSWISEYGSRVQYKRKWKKLEGRHVHYRVIDHGVDFVKTDFATDRLLTYCKGSNTVTLCSLHDGRNPSFVPGGHMYVVCYALNWNYLVYASSDKIVAKSFNGAASEWPQQGIQKILVNSTCDKFKIKADIIACDAHNVMKFNLKGDKLGEAAVGEVFDIRSDFETVVIVAKSGIFVWQDAVKSIHIDLDDVVQVDCDFHGKNVVICRGSDVLIVNWETERTREFKFDARIKQGQLQQNMSAVEGALYAAVLENQQVVVLEIRAPQVVNSFYARFNYRWSRNNDPDEVNSIVLNSCVILIGGVEGYVFMYDVLTGEYIRETHLKHKNAHGSKVNFVCLSEIQDTSGLIVSGNAAEYFQFGELEKEFAKKKHNKVGKTDEIKNALDEFDRMNYLEDQNERMREKYNGVDVDEEDELMVAYALSESQVPTDVERKHLAELERALRESEAPTDDELERALRESEREQREQREQQPHDDDEELRKVLALSLHDY